MTNSDVQSETRANPATAGAFRTSSYVMRRFARAFATSPTGFEIVLPDGTVHRQGNGRPEFRLVLNNRNGWRALSSLDQGKFADAYVTGDIDIEGDLLCLFSLRTSLGDSHLFTTIWRFLQPLLFGQVRTNQQAISAHYDIDPDFFLSFLDPTWPCYTQGLYGGIDDSLAAATERKFDYCFDRLRLKPGDHILEIGPGWGAWFEYASQRGVKCTGISISKESIDYLGRRARELGYDWELVHADLLTYQSERKYDAIVIMGVIEHLPQYDRVLAQFEALLKPGGRIFLDGSANTKKYELSSFMVKYIYPGNHSFLVLHDFLAQLANTSFKTMEIFDDSYSYYLTFLQWARNFDANAESVVQRFGEFNYRRFRLYLWGATNEFLTRSLDCYRMVIYDPVAEASRGGS